jgi:hypothetical protein
MSVTDLEVYDALKAVAYDRAPVEFWAQVKGQLDQGARLEDAEGIYAEILLDLMAYALTPDTEVVKHGQHDQSSHGNWAKGGGSTLTLDAGIADSIVERVRANGGLSVNMLDGSEPTKGYMVARGGTTGAIVSADDFYDEVKGPEALGDFLVTYQSDLTGGSYLGLWHNKADGQVYLDVSDNIMDRDAAVAAGKDRNQISIWDVANFEEIETGGTGELGKAAEGDPTAGPIQDDGSRDQGLRKNDLGSVHGARTALITFEPGLRPVLKHGSHDQKTHGNWSSGRMADPAAGDRRYTGTLEHIRRFEQNGIGPAKDLLNRPLTDGEPLDWNEREALKAGFGDVYNVSHTGEGKDGSTITIKSEVSRVVVTNSGEVAVLGDIFDADTGGQIGRFDRKISMGAFGVPEVEHVWFKIEDEGARGTGFGTKFIQQSEGYYISQGFSRITTHAGLEDGGYTWARAGFDWDYSDGPPWGSVGDALGSWYGTDTDIGDQAEKWSDAIWGEDIDAIPRPSEIAMLGYTPGASSWPGRDIMTGTHWYGEKPLPRPPDPLPSPYEQLTFP